MKPVKSLLLTLLSLVALTASLISAEPKDMKENSEVPLAHGLERFGEPEQQDQHENAPEHAECREQRAQLVTPQREEDFLQAVEHG